MIFLDIELGWILNVMQSSTSSCWRVLIVIPSIKSVRFTALRLTLRVSSATQAVISVREVSAVCQSLSSFKTVLLFLHKFLCNPSTTLYRKIIAFQKMLSLKKLISKKITTITLLSTGYYYLCAHTALYSLHLINHFTFGALCRWIYPLLKLLKDWNQDNKSKKGYDNSKSNIIFMMEMLISSGGSQVIDSIVVRE